METITDKRCRSSSGQAFKEFEKLYERAFKDSYPPYSIWLEFDAAWMKLLEALKARPIAVMDIERHKHVFMSEVTAICSKYKRYEQQAGTDPKGGGTRPG